MIDLNQPEHFDTLSEEQKSVLLNWIRKNIIPIKSVNREHSSYNLKHRFEENKAEGGFYITNGQFKGAMLTLGFEPERRDELNWLFRISNKSAGIKRQ